jgi:anaerobic ribonucleoside-triphosphate reductase-activating protein
MESSKLYLYHRASGIKTLGPGLRYAIWTQGCIHNCKNCIAPDTHPLDKNGYWLGIEEIYLEIEENMKKENIRGITISGGEPFLQAKPLVELIKRLKERTQLDIICFTGFEYSNLKNKKDESIEYILANIDILIDGKYIEEKNENNYLRGSSNQNIIFLSERYREYENDMKNLKNRNIEIMWINDREIFIAGIPYKEREDK